MDSNASSGFNFNNLYYVLMIVFFVAIFAMPVITRSLRFTQRKAKVKKIEEMRGSRVISVIHRQEGVSILGIPVYSYLDIENAIDIIKAIRMTPKDMPIDLILHTPGGIAFAAEQISMALLQHKGKITAFVPHYAMSAGSLLAITATEICMSPFAVVGPTDPQLQVGLFDQYPAASIVRAMEIPNLNREDKFLILADVSKMAVQQLEDVAYKAVVGKVGVKKAKEITRLLASGVYTHDHPIGVQDVSDMGLKVDTEVPKEVYDLLDLYDTPKYAVVYNPEPKPPSKVKRK